MSSQGQLAGWQFRQTADALQLLLVDLSQAPAGKGIDWDWWKAGGRVLAPDHPTLAKSQAPGAGPRFANAVAFLFKQVLERPLEDVRFSRPKRQQRLPVALTREEVRRLCEAMDGTFGLMARLMSGTGMRLMECVRLRVADVDFGNRSIMVRNGKGGKDRTVPLPERLREAVEAHLARVKAQHERDLAAGAGAGSVYLPDALGRKAISGKAHTQIASVRGELESVRGELESVRGELVEP